MSRSILPIGLCPAVIAMATETIAQVDTNGRRGGGAVSGGFEGFKVEAENGRMGNARVWM